MRFFRPLRTVNAMTFDLDDTLYDNEPVIKHATGQLQQYLSEHYPQAGSLTPQQWQAIKMQLIEDTPDLASDMGELRLRSLQVALKHDVSEHELEDAARACFTFFYRARSDFTLTDEVHNTLEVLAKRVPLIGITNGNVDAEQVGFAHYFTTILHASLSRPMKPHEAMFEEAARLCALPPTEILHVGDNLEKDVMGAHKAGFQTAWFACNRTMNLNNERTHVLPGVMLDSLEDLLHLVA